MNFILSPLSANGMSAIFGAGASIGGKIVNGIF